MQDPSCATVVAKFVSLVLFVTDGKPDLYFFPRLMLVTGPLHILWNAFESSVKSLEMWPAYKKATPSLFKQIFKNKTYMLGAAAPNIYKAGTERHPRGVGQQGIKKCVSSHMSC